MRDFLTIVVISALCFVCGLWITKVQCDAQTSEIGMQSKWGILSGCLVKTKDGAWVPLENYRAL